jgi:hypothetical protein
LHKFFKEAARKNPSDNNNKAVPVGTALLLKQKIRNLKMTPF